MAELTRFYHGHRVTSVMNWNPVKDSDGWTHTVGGKTFNTLAEAIQYAKSSSPTTATLEDAGIIHDDDDDADIVVG